MKTPAPKTTALLVWLFFVPAGLAQGSGIDILPTPHYVEPLDQGLHVEDGAVRVWQAQTGLDVARELLVGDHPELSFPDAKAAAGADIVLWDYAASPNPGVELNFLDKQLLDSSPLRRQSYVVRSTGKAIWVVGGGPIGVLYGAATVSQLLHKNGAAVDAAGAYIRDYPDFEFRASADWLLNIEASRWALDRGQGLEAYGRLVRQKLDQAARFKINAALIDGFGWDIEQRVAGYAPLMRDLNQYARQRGIHLQYGGYGAAYDMAQRKNEYHGKVFLNRESYPNGAVYQCLAFPEHERRHRSPHDGQLPRQRRAEPPEGRGAGALRRRGRAGHALHPPRRLLRFRGLPESVAGALRALPPALAQRRAERARRWRRSPGARLLGLDRSGQPRAPSRPQL